VEDKKATCGKILEDLDKASLLKITLDQQNQIEGTTKAYRGAAKAPRGTGKRLQATSSSFSCRRG
jgi:hypothetical protein